MLGAGKFELAHLHARYGTSHEEKYIDEVLYVWFYYSACRNNVFPQRILKIFSPKPIQIQSLSSSPIPNGSPLPCCFCKKEMMLNYVRGALVVHVVLDLTLLKT